MCHNTDLLVVLRSSLQACRKAMLVVLQYVEQHRANRQAPGLFILGERYIFRIQPIDGETTITADNCVQYGDPFQLSDEDQSKYLRRYSDSLHLLTDRSVAKTFRFRRLIG